jgi:uncharacterized membrane protein YfcA
LSDYGALDVVLGTAAGFGAGIVNAIAGGGSLISFPVLLAVGVPTLRANATNTVALCPGYAGGALAQREDLPAGSGRVRVLVAGGLGGLVGAGLLLVTSEDAFDTIVPFLILAACLLLAVQQPVRRWVAARAPEGVVRPTYPTSAVAAVFLASIYGGYFGAGLGIVLLAVLGVLLDAPLRSANALKSALSLVINVLAAVVLAPSGEVVWLFVVPMAVASLLGGVVGGRLAQVVPAGVLRTVVVAFGIVVALNLWR